MEWNGREGKEMRRGADAFYSLNIGSNYGLAKSLTVCFCLCGEKVPVHLGIVTIMVN